MYAAAGGASLASRQARQRQRQKRPMAKPGKATDILPKPKQIGQYSNYTDDSPPVRLSRVERAAAASLKPPSQQPANERRHSTSNYQQPNKEPKARIRESPSICIPVQQRHSCQTLQGHHSHHQHHQHHPSIHESTTTGVGLEPSPSLQLPQILIPEDGSSLERRCSFVRQVEEEKEGKEDVLDKCNHLCNFEIKDKNYEHQDFMTEYDFFGSLDYPFSECSQGRAAWQERERGRRCSASEESRQHRLKQTEAHHRWMKRNRIHDTSYGGSSDDEEWSTVAYHQSAAANALLYVGLGTFAIGSVIFFVGTGEKGFKTLELRLIGPTLVACGLLCCLVRVLLCACPSNCFRGRKKTRLKNDEHSCCAHSRLPLTTAGRDQHVSTSFERHKKKVSIAPSGAPSTSTKEPHQQQQQQRLMSTDEEISIPIITVPPTDDDDDDDDDVFVSQQQQQRRKEDNSVNDDDVSLIELDALDAVNYELQSVSSFESETVIEVDVSSRPTKHQRSREPALLIGGGGGGGGGDEVVRFAGSGSGGEGRGVGVSGDAKAVTEKRETHSGIVLSPLQLGQ